MLQPGVLQPGSLERCSLAEWSGLEGMLHAVGGVGLDWRLAVFSHARRSERSADMLVNTRVNDPANSSVNTVANTQVKTLLNTLVIIPY